MYDVTNGNQVTWKAPDVEIKKPTAKNVKNGKILNTAEPGEIPVLTYLSITSLIPITNLCSFKILYNSDFFFWNFTAVKIST